MLVTPHRRIGVFIDVQNMYYSARNLFNRKVNFAAIVEHAVGDADLVRAIAYTISTKTGDESPFFEALRKSGIEVASKELLEYNSGVKKGDWDVGITIDIVRMLDMLDVVVLVSGDGDYTPLVDYVRSRGRIMHVMSFRESTSTMLVNAADTYTNLSDDQSLFLIGERERATPSARQTAPGRQPRPPRGKAPRRRNAPDDTEERIHTEDDNMNDDASSGGMFLPPTDDAAEDMGTLEENRSRRLSF